MACGLWGRGSIATTGCLVAGVLVLALGSTPAQAAPRCVVSRHAVRGVRTSKILKLTSDMVVYRTTISSEGSPGSRDVWACGRKTNHFVLVGREELNPEYGTEGALSGIQVAGDWLIVKQETELVSIAECYKYMFEGGGCPSIHESFLLANAARGLEGSISDVNVLAAGKMASLSTLLLSDDGAVAWLQTPEKETISLLYGCVALAAQRRLACKPLLVAQGAIPGASLSLVGTTLGWTAAGQRQSSVL